MGKPKGSSDSQPKPPKSEVKTGKADYYPPGGRALDVHPIGVVSGVLRSTVANHDG